MLNFQEMIAELTKFWAEQGALVHQGYDLEVGAGTFNPATFLRCLGPEPYSAVYVEPSRRPKDGRYGENPNRLQFYHQMQVIIKPSPANIQELYLESLRRIGLKLNEHDIRFVHDDWENPTIGAWGLGWEIWLDGMEVTQFTYFQQVGGIPVKPVSGEITYGLERLAMYLQGVDSFFDLKWNDDILYGEIFKRSEFEWSHYNFHGANANMWLKHFDDFEKEAKALIEKNLPIPAYDFVMKASHAFNILDARGVISVTERTGYISRIRALAKLVAENYLKSREEQKYPLLRNQKETLIPQPQPKIVPPYDPSKKEDFLLEIGSEELPASFVPIGLTNLENGVRALLKEHGLSYENLKCYGTPRRLAVLVTGLAEGTVAIKMEKKGPSVNVAFDEEGKPTEIGKGFFRSLHLEPVNLAEIDKSHVEIRKVKESDYLFATIEKSGVSTLALLATHLPALIINLDFPKKMRWGSFELEYARPLRWICALFGKDEIPFVVADIASGRNSYGHRQLAPQMFAIFQPGNYLEELKKHFVMADVAERREAIRKGLRELEDRTEGKVVSEERVLPQVLHLVEWPHLELGSFDPKFLQAPSEILISEMIEHQKYFPLADKGGNLIPHFAICCNNTPSAKIRHGNEKALTPRLADGLFLYEEDLKTPLNTFIEKLKNVTFHKDLGSVAAKTNRLERYVEALHPYFGETDLKKAKRAAALSKADLVTQLVGEFPELQGTVGKFYAEKGGEGHEVAAAIDEHWMPRGEKAPLPKTSVGILLSISEKIDNLLGCFSLGLIPTSSSDPYALRRQALGLIKMIIAGKIVFPIRKALSACFDIFVQNHELAPKLKDKIVSEKEKILTEIEEFLLNRSKTIFQEAGFEKDEIEAVVAKGAGDFYDRFQLLQTLHKMRQDRRDEFQAVHNIHTRAKKIVQNVKDVTQNVKPELFKEDAEKTLYSKAVLVKEKRQDYENYFLSLAELGQPVAALFDTVKILDDDPRVRANRISLVREIQSLCEQFCDFGKIQEHDLVKV